MAINLLENGDELLRSAVSAEDTSLHGDHLESEEIVSGIGGSSAVTDDEALVTAIIGLTHGSVNAHIGGDTHKDDVLDLLGAEDQIKRGCDERAFARFINNDFVGKRIELRNEVLALLALDKDATKSALAADFTMDLLGAPELVGGTIRKISLMTFASVDDKVTLFACRLEDALNRADASAHGLQIIAHVVHVTAGSTKVILHVNANDCGVFLVELSIERPSIRNRANNVLETRARYRRRHRRRARLRLNVLALESSNLLVCLRKLRLQLVDDSL